MVLLMRRDPKLIIWLESLPVDSLIVIGLAMFAVVLALAVIFSQLASAQLLNPPIGPGSIMPIGPSTNSSGVTPPPTCDGTIDLSTGCVQPMLGGL
jgi:hypothetical protein